MGVWVYTCVLNATTLDTYAQVLEKDGVVTRNLVVNVNDAEEAAIQVNRMLDEILGVDGIYETLQLDLMGELERLNDGLVADRMQANFANLLLRAVKPDSATRAVENDTARARAKQGQLQVAATLPKITPFTAAALHAGFRAVQSSAVVRLGGQHHAGGSPSWTSPGSRRGDPRWHCGEQWHPADHPDNDVQTDGG